MMPFIQRKSVYSLKGVSALGLGEGGGGGGGGL